jgi:hypothetical protein
MPSYYVLGHVALVPAVGNFDAVMDTLNHHGAGLSGGSLDRGGTWAVIGERVDAASVKAAVEEVARRIAAAEERRQKFDREIRFSVGPFVAEHITEFMPDGSEGTTHAWPLRPTSVH